MSEFQKGKMIPKKAEKNMDEAEGNPNSAAENKKRQLKKLDEFIEEVLQEAGSEFLDEFKQIEGE